MQKEKKRELLAQHFLFRQLLPAELDKILSLATEREFQDGQMIFQKDEDAAGMMVLLEGRVMVSATSEDGRELILNHIEPGGILGEISMIDGRKRSATAAAVGTCRLLYLGRNDFIPFLRSNPDVAIQLLIVLCGKLRATSDVLEDVGLLTVSGRLARYLIKLSTPDGAKPKPNSTGRLDHSQREIATRLGTTRETINRTLQLWKSEGLIKLQNSEFTIFDPAKLIERARRADPDD